MPIKIDAGAFKTEISDRGITSLVHFTPTINLLSILTEQKIYSRAKLEELGIQQTDLLDFVSFTDPIRYDDKSYINFSIEFPNHYLFSRFRARTLPLIHIHWCVVKCDPRLIYLDNTLFSVTNAASISAKRDFGITGDLAKFRLMFAPQLDVRTTSSSRTVVRDRLPAKYPTDVQAEVLVKDSIPISEVIAICFENTAEMESTKAAILAANHDAGISKFCVDQKLFQVTRL